MVVCSLPSPVISFHIMGVLATALCWQLLISSLHGVDGAGPVCASADSVNETLLSACAAGRGEHQVQSGRAMSFFKNLACFKIDSTRKMSFHDG